MPVVTPEPPGDRPQRPDAGNGACKRLLDCLLSGAGLLLLSPVLFATALAVRVTMGSPVLFRHRRAGKDGRTFVMYKFRTMTDARDADGKPLPDEARMTPTGTFLRRFSLDELPQLLNVLKGDMSLVGPRPLLPEYVPLYSPEQRRRLDVLPGITGWAQVNGRNALSWEQKFALDAWYVDNRSLALDVRILFRTAASVLSGRGVSQDGCATMPRFEGTVRTHEMEDLR